MRFDHINISAKVEFMEELKDFYCEILDLSVGPRLEIPFPGYWFLPQRCRSGDIVNHSTLYCR